MPPEGNLPGGTLTRDRISIRLGSKSCAGGTARNGAKKPSPCRGISSRRSRILTAPRRGRSGGRAQGSILNRAARRTVRRIRLHSLLPSLSLIPTSLPDGRSSRPARRDRSRRDIVRRAGGTGGAYWPLPVSWWSALLLLAWWLASGCLRRGTGSSRPLRQARPSHPPWLTLRHLLLPRAARAKPRHGRRAGVAPTSRRLLQRIRACPATITSSLVTCRPGVPRLQIRPPWLVTWAVWREQS